MFLKRSIPHQKGLYDLKQGSDVVVGEGSGIF